LTNLEGVIEEIRSICGTGMELGLERVRRLLARLGNPEAETRFVHVGGTNGKGSVTVMIEAVLQDAGYKTGSFISPHLHSYTERYRVNGEAIADDELAFLLEGLLPDLKALAREGAAPTEFEALTAAAFLCFVRNKADLAVMEVGLGGRLDATNVIVPEVAVITNVSLDHTEILGHTLREVAGEKAGIIKRGVPVVTGAEGEALEVIARRCRELDAPLVVVGRDVTWSEQPAAGAPPFLVVCGRRQRYRDLRLPLWGRHQRTNAACAVAALEVLQEKGWVISERHVRNGLAALAWAGRFEIVPGKPPVVLDGAHNPAGAAALAEAVASRFPGEKAVVVLGILDDKAREEMVHSLAKIAGGIVVTRPPGPRAGHWDEVARVVGGLGLPVAAVEKVEDALVVARKLSGPGGLMVVTGSLYLVGRAREILVKSGTVKVNKGG